MKALIFSHQSDPDGWTSAALCDQVLRYLGFERSIIGVDYASGMMPIIEDVMRVADEFDVIFLCDLTFDPPTMLALRDTQKFHWVDHHLTSIEDSVEHGYADLPGLRSTDFAACELTFRYLTDTFTNIGNLKRSMDIPVDIPRIVSLIGRHDTFRQDEEWDTQVLPMNCLLTSIASEIRIGSPAFTTKWSEILEWTDSDIISAIDVGVAILRYRKAVADENAPAVHVASFVEFPDMRFLALNGGKGSDGFDGVDPTGFDGMLSYRYNGKDWSISLYGWDNSPDLSVISKHFDGGGHAHASGARLPDLSAISFSPYTKPTVEGEVTLPTEHPFNLPWCCYCAEVEAIPE